MTAAASTSATRVATQIATDDPALIRTIARTCPLCEATCGLEISVRGDDVVRIRGNRDDVFSRGFLCPKGSTIKDLDNDPDRIRNPMIRGDGGWREVSWDEAFAAVADGLAAVRATHGNDSVAAYIGNPTAHNHAASAYIGPLLKSLRTKNIYSASTVDQMPKQLSAGLMFGAALSIPIADIDRTDYLLMLGANPWESNGSLMTAPDFPGRITALINRGGTLVVVDPRRTKTAEHATRHVPIRPGTDAAFLLGICKVLFGESLVRVERYAGDLHGVEDLRQLLTGWDLDDIAAFTGVGKDEIERIARELAHAPAAAVYGRIGTCTQEFGTLASWLIDVVNVLTGNLDRPGGAMFTTPVAGGATTRGTPGRGRGVATGRWHSRVRRAPEVFGELPVAVLPEEIETAGAGQVRALFSIAGNPVLSAPDSDRLDRALASLEFMVSVDIYLNETTKHAHVFLPAPRILTRSHYDVSLYQLAIRNVGNWSAPVFPLADYEMAEWEILARLTHIANGGCATDDIHAIDDERIREQLAHLVQSDVPSLSGRNVDELFAMLSPWRGPDRHLDLALRTGPYGDCFGAKPDGLSLRVLANNPNGVDCGALVPRLPGVLRTPTGAIELTPPSFVADLERLRMRMQSPLTATLSANSTSAVSPGQNAASPSAMLLVGRRDLRSNNSWMHNVRVLVKGKQRCTLQIHPDDAHERTIPNGATCVVTSSAGRVEVVAEHTESIMRGVVSIPHGWGHDHDATRMRIANAHAGVNCNRLVPGDVLDVLSGNAATNGVPVHVEATRECVESGV